VTALLIGLVAGLTGGAWAEEPPTQMQDFTAYTVQQGQWRVGLTRLDYGLLDNVSIGTSALFLLVGPNGNAKVTAAETERLSFSLEGSYYAPYSALLENLSGGEGGSNITMRVTPVAWTGSWEISPKWSAHYGNTWTLGRVEGELTGGQIAELMGAVTGGGVDESIQDALGLETLYAGALGRFTLASSNFAVMWRRKENASFIFESNNYLWISGMVVGTVGQETEGAEVGAGVAAIFEQALETVPSAVSLSWQRSWDRLNLRVGIPLTAGNPFAFTQAFQLYWLLGPKD